MKVKLSKANTWRLYGFEPAKNPRYKTPIEKGIAWEAVRQRLHKEEKDCYTCNKTNLIENGWKADCGHYKPVAIVGSNNVRSWQRKFIHLQCSYCNGAGQGMAVEYRLHLVRDYGEEVVADFDTNYRKVWKVTNWIDIINSYVQESTL